MFSDRRPRSPRHREGVSNHSSPSYCRCLPGIPRCRCGQRTVGGIHYHAAEYAPVGHVSILQSLRASQTFRVSSEPSADWLRFEPAVITVGAGAPFSIRVDVHTAPSHAPGSYRTNLQVVCASCAVSGPAVLPGCCQASDRSDGGQRLQRPASSSRLFRPILLWPNLRVRRPSHRPVPLPLPRRRSRRFRVSCASVPPRTVGRIHSARDHRHGWMVRVFLAHEEVGPVRSWMAPLLYLARVECRTTLCCVSAGRRERFRSAVAAGSDGENRRDCREGAGREWQP